MTETENTVKCPECNGRNLHTNLDRGETVCQDCGLVVQDDIIDPTAEWNVYSLEQGDMKSRTGAPATVLLHDKGLSTDIDWQNKDYSGKTIPNHYRSQIHRMRKWQKRARISNSLERNLAIALAELERMGSRMGLPKMVREAGAVIYKKAIEQRISRGRSIDLVIAGSLYLACRQCGVPRTLDEITEASRCGRKEIGRVERLIKRKLGIRLPHLRGIDFVSWFASDLGLSASTELMARRLCEELEDKELDIGISPSSIGAATLYIAGVMNNQRRTQREISEISGVTEVTIRNRYKQIVQTLQLDIKI